MYDIDQLEELLSCDDLFLQYFNSFLALPSFGQRLRYDRLTGTFHKLQDLEDFQAKKSDNQFEKSVYGAKDEEKERLLVWIKDHRLQKFFKSRLYREFKLCRLLIRPLDERRGSSRIRGYSRLSVVTTLTSYTTNDFDGSVTSESNKGFNGILKWGESGSVKPVSFGMGSGEHSRPPSKTTSLPPKLHSHRTWSGRAVYDKLSSSVKQSDNDGFLRFPEQAKNYRIKKPLDEKELMEMRQIQRDHDHASPWISDSGLGTTALGYTATLATSEKTRNNPTRADTLGVDSRWESEPRSEYTADEPNEEEDSLRDANAVVSGSLYRGKSALRKADSPSKHHRATIVLPKNGKAKEIPKEESTKWPEFENVPIFENHDNNFDDDDDAEESEFDDLDYLEFSDRDSSCEETETEMVTVQRAHSTTLQHVKEAAVGNVWLLEPANRIEVIINYFQKSNMDEFLNFLRGTAGFNLAMFWLDVEAFKDVLMALAERHSILEYEGESTLDIHEEEEFSKVWRHCIFRDIIDRHKLTFSEEAKTQIRLSQHDEGFGYEVFARTQYDALRRLRSYWIPRYIVHCSRTPGFQEKIASGAPVVAIDNSGDEQFLQGYLPPLLSLETLSSPSHIFQTLSEKMFTVTPLEAIASELKSTAGMVSTPQIRNMSAASTRNVILMRALSMEPDAGYPYKEYLIEFANEEIINAYLFWLNCEHLPCVLLPENENNLDPYLISLQHGVMLYRNFLKKGVATKYIPLPSKMKKYIRGLDNLFKKAANNPKDAPPNIPVSLFKPAKNHCFSLLLSTWKKYKEFEAKNFYRAKHGILDTDSSTRSETVEDVQFREEVVSKKFTNAPSEPSTDANSKPWFTDDEDTTETDSASTMYSYDVDRIRQMAALIRKKGAKKPQRPVKKPQKPRRKTAIGKQSKDVDDEDTKSKHPSKVKFTLPGQEQKDSSDKNGKSLSRGTSEAGTLDTEETSELSHASHHAEKKKSKAAHRHAGKLNYAQIKENKLLHTYFRKYVAQCESMEIQNVTQMYALCEAIRFVPETEFDRRAALAREVNKTYLSSSGPKQIAISSEYSQPFISQLPNPPNDCVEAIQHYITPSLNQAAFNFSLGFGAALKEYKLDIRSDLSHNITKAELALRTLTLKPSSKRRRALGKHSARQPPNEGHKISFVKELNRASEGDLPVELLHFFKYLQGFGTQEGFPLIHNDLLFYVEVAKFLACYHNSYDLVTLKRKVQCILDCFINSDFQPTLQIDIKTGTAERLRRAGENFINDKGRDPHSPALFDDAQHTVFNELLPFWAGFYTARQQIKPSDTKPVLKAERLQKKRLEAFQKAPAPKVEFSIPKSFPKFDMRGLEFTFSVDGGIQWKEWSEVSSSRSSSPGGGFGNLQKGVIEVVKMPPKGHQRRIIRRGNFSIRKLNTSRKDGNANSQGNKNFGSNEVNGQNKNINYATSIS